MTIYHVSWVGDDDNTQHRYFTSKTDANKLQRRLKTTIDAPGSMCKFLNSMKQFEVEISKKGIIEMLNSKFDETCG